MTPPVPHRVMLLHTGGTLGMTGDPLAPGDLNESILEEVPEIARIAELDVEVVCNLDSSDIGPLQWTHLAKRIAAHAEDYDGFVVIHGTDTMAWTASALSFALPSLAKPVVLTGAQRPLKAVRTDARRNLADAVESAARGIPEVAICFDGLLLRGCRARKTHVHDYRAFTSPGCPPLARLGVDMRLGAHVRSAIGPFTLREKFSRGVMVLRVTPGWDTIWFSDWILNNPEVRAIILVAYGSGTVPTNESRLAEHVHSWIDAGMDVLVTTDSHGKVDLSLYENSRALAEAGALSGERLTLESAVTKMMHALALYPDDQARRRQYLLTDIAGELGSG